jgi:hypothetical protein
MTQDKGLIKLGDSRGSAVGYAISLEIVESEQSPAETLVPVLEGWKEAVLDQLTKLNNHRADMTREFGLEYGGDVDDYIEMAVDQISELNQLLTACKTIMEGALQPEQEGDQ